MLRGYNEKVGYVALKEKTVYRGYAGVFLVFVLFIVDFYVLWQYLTSTFGYETIFVVGISIYTMIGVSIVYFLYTFVSSLRRTLGRAEDVIDVLKTSKERYALAVSGSSEGLWDWDVRRNTVYVSPYWKKMLGYDEEDEITTMSFWRKQIHPDDRKVVERALDQHLEGHTSYYTAEYRMHTKGGIYKWIYDKGKAVWDEDGNVVRVAGSSRDITNVKDVEEVLKSKTKELEDAKARIEEEMRNSKKFEQAVKSATDAIVIMTPPGNIIYTNPAWETLTGYKLDDIRGERFSFLVEQETPPEIISEMKETMKQGKPFVSEDMIGSRRNGNTFKMQVSLFPIKDQERILFYTALAEDITKRKEVDKAKTEFVSLASHQLRTPLSAIRWYSEMLISGSAGELTDTQKKYLEEIYEANKRMIELVGALLNVSRIDLGTFTIEPELTHLPDVADSAIKELSPQIEEKNLSVERNYGPVPEITVDSKLIRIVFQNLLSNSVKYTPKNGHVTIDIHREDNRIAFSVSDDGYGIPASQQEKIFTKLFRADNAQEVDPGGTGLGLYIVQAVMEKSGGNIWFESEEDKGTTFYGILPIEGSPRKTGSKELGYYG